jgi:hypothetical protein
LRSYIISSTSKIYLSLLSGQHLEPLSPTVVYPPVPPFGAASGTLEMQYEGKTSFLSENKHKLHF